MNLENTCLSSLLAGGAPDWLRVPLTYYQSTGDNFRGRLFCRLATGRLEPDLVEAGETLLQFMHTACLILDDVMDKSPTRRGQSALHEVYGESAATVWSVGIAFYVFEFIRKHFSSHVGLADKLTTIYSEVALGTLEGQHYDLKTQGEDSKDFVRTAGLKTSLYTVKFPCTLYVLLETNDLGMARRVLTDHTLTEIGVWFQAENDFRGNFEPNNADVANGTWTKLMEMAAGKCKRDGRQFPHNPTRMDAQKLFEELDIYYDYVREREAWLTKLQTTALANYSSWMSAGGSAESVEILDGQSAQTKQYTVHTAISFCLTFFKAYSLPALVWKLPQFELLSGHEEVQRGTSEWLADSLDTDAELMLTVRGAIEDMGSAFSGIHDKELVRALGKLVVVFAAFDDVFEAGLGLVDDFLRGWPMAGQGKLAEIEWTAGHMAKCPEGVAQLNKYWETVQENLQVVSEKLGNHMWDEFARSIRAIKTVREWIDRLSVDEYYDVRAFESGASFYFAVMSAWLSKGRSNGRISTGQTSFGSAYCKAFVMVNDLASFARERASLKAESNMALINVISVMQREQPHLSLQQTVFRLEDELEEHLKELQTLAEEAGLGRRHIASFMGTLAHSRSERYTNLNSSTPAIIVCKSTKFMLLQ